MAFDTKAIQDLVERRKKELEAHVANKLGITVGKEGVMIHIYIRDGVVQKVTTDELNVEVDLTEGEEYDIFYEDEVEDNSVLDQDNE